ncbi:hypothetical protein AZE42_10789, partial [Rhizopogon vesiculosus]
WPEYEHLDWPHPLDLYTPAGLLTRSQLAVQVAYAFAQFIAQQEVQGYPPAQHGATCCFDNGGISYNRLILSGLWYVCDDTWLPEVIVDFR